MSKFKVGQVIILREDLSHTTWYTKDRFCVQKIHHPGTLRVDNKIGVTRDQNDMNFYELIECVNLVTGVSSLYHETKFILYPLQSLRDERIDMIFE